MTSEERLKEIYKELNELSRYKDRVREALSNKDYRRIIFSIISDISENVKNIVDSNEDREIAALFSEKERSRIIGTRNRIAHRKEELNLEAVRKLVSYTLLADIHPRVHRYIQIKERQNKKQTTQAKRANSSSGWGTSIAIILVMIVVLVLCVFSFELFANLP